MSLWIAAVCLLQTSHDPLEWRLVQGMRLVGEVVQKYESAQDDLSIEFHDDVTIEVVGGSPGGDLALDHAWRHRQLVVDGEVVRLTNPAPTKFRETRGLAGEWKGASPNDGEPALRRRLGFALAPTFGPEARTGARWTRSYTAARAGALPDATLEFRAADAVERREPWGATITVTATIQDGAISGTGRWVCAMSTGFPISAHVRLKKVPIPDGEGALADYVFTWRLLRVEGPGEAGRAAPDIEPN